MPIYPLVMMFSPDLPQVLVGNHFILLLSTDRITLDQSGEGSRNNI